MVNIIIVGATTCLTGLLSGYEKLGIAARVLLVVLRIVQGIGLGASLEALLLCLANLLRSEAEGRSGYRWRT
ncbi:MAG: hypothetical protein WCD57_07665 [Acidobacteriaceae bacterium]